MGRRLPLSAVVSAMAATHHTVLPPNAETHHLRLSGAGRNPWVRPGSLDCVRH